MVRATILFLAFLFVGCAQSVSKDDLQMLNGYWEITEVEFRSGEMKEYSLGTTVDFIYLEGMKGYRKKVHPNILGEFETSDDAQKFEVKILKDSVVLTYQNSLSSWTERLIKLKNDSFAVSNGEGTIYSYKRYEPLNLIE